MSSFCAPPRLCSTLVQPALPGAVRRCAESVHPLVESVLMEHPGAGRDDRRRQAEPGATGIVTAFLVPTALPELGSEIQSHGKTAGSPYRYPREIHFVTDLAKTISGEVGRRTELRRRLLREGEAP